ncbi:MAG TPA: D-glycero-beta-D-manno-heptose 1-phosphate adenylyltransferase [Gaiellaceae bacterium]|nr:D-glycero-beta-D-manno-heptose 1-phosphate adenylyltransferase [Gaiellaceae bacterium]
MSLRAPLVVVGDALLDRDVDGAVERLSPEGPIPVLDEEALVARPGGAALAAALAAGDGRPVVLVTALAQDEAAEELRRLLARAAVEVVDLGLDARTPEKIRLRCDGRVLLRLDRGGRSAAIAGSGEEAAAPLAEAAAVLVSDYGRGLADLEPLRRLLADTAVHTPLVWDPHPRGARPVGGARLVTPNHAEARRLAPGVEGEDRTAVAARARALQVEWEADAVAVTLGAGGALLVGDGAPPVLSPAPPTTGGDPCGAGDRFSSAVTGLLADGRLLADAVDRAVREASSFVAGGGAGSLGSRWRPAVPEAAEDDAEALVSRVRAQGGSVVMTGGCFDLLHAGHVRMLAAARRLGDCLVVCLNSDESVRRLKGGGRPVVGQEDREAVLLALESVDAVVVFDEDTPAAVLERFRPDVFAKGGDYALERLPEADVVARWGAEAVVLPYEEGRSTTRLLEEVLERGAR